MLDIDGSRDVDGDSAKNGHERGPGNLSYREELSLGKLLSLKDCCPQVRCTFLLHSCGKSRNEQSPDENANRGYCHGVAGQETEGSEEGSTLRGQRDLTYLAEKVRGKESEQKPGEQLGGSWE